MRNMNVFGFVVNTSNCVFVFRELASAVRGIAQTMLFFFK